MTFYILQVRNILSYEHKPSVGQLLVIEVNLVLVRLGLSSIYTLPGSHCNNEVL